MVAVITRSTTARTGGALRPNLVLIPGGQQSSPLQLLPPLSRPAPGALQDLEPVAPAAPVAPVAPIGFRIVAPPKRSILRHWRVLAVFMITLAVVAGGWLVVRAIGGLGGGGSLTSSGEPVALASAGGGETQTPGQTYSAALQSDVHPTQGHEWVVRPGDTLWGIVEASGVRGDPRPVVDKMAAELKGQPLQVGQSVAVP